MIMQAFEFNNFEKCREVMDLLDDVQYVEKYKHQFRDRFEEMVSWFIDHYLKIPTGRPILEAH
ncbi:hypothetical protein Hanom_Chr14g01291601 [Helianthus anomalus]